MKKIVLIKPIVSYVPADYNVSPPLGVMYLASVLRGHGAYDVEIIDMRVENLSITGVERKLNAVKPDVVGISGLSTESDMVHKLAQTIKHIRNDIRVIVGGPHASSCPELIMQDANIDFVVAGEGEFALLELLNSFGEERKNLQNISGLFFREGKTIIRNDCSYIFDLDKLPFPSWDLIEIEKYAKKLRFLPASSNCPYMSIITSRGCPYNCIYCHNIMGKKFRVRSPENIMAEIKILHDRYGIKDIEILDDCFNFDHERVSKICDLIIASGIKIKISFPNGLRSDLLDEKIIDKLYDAGTIRISFAIESGSPRIQKTIKKNMDLNKLSVNIKYAAGKKIHAHGFFLMGLPDETKEDLRATLKFACRSYLHSASFFIANPFPGTELYKITKGKEKNYYSVPPNVNYANAGFNLSLVSDRELINFRQKCFFCFYCDPKRILRVFCDGIVKKRYMLYYLWLIIKKAFPKRFFRKIR